MRLWQTPAKSVDSVENPGGALVEPVDNCRFSVVGPGALCYHRSYPTRVVFPRQFLENTCSGIISCGVALARRIRPEGFSTSSWSHGLACGDLSTTQALRGTLFSTDRKVRAFDESPYAGSLRVSGGSLRKGMSTDVESSVDGPGNASSGRSVPRGMDGDSQVATAVYRCLRIECSGSGC